MNLIIGGAYQGKLDYAKHEFALGDGDIFTCTESPELDFSRRCIDRLEEYTLWCARNSVDTVEMFRSHRAEWADSILICQDIFCGVVPIDKDMRAWRELTGRLCGYLSGEAESVTRMFCHIATKLK